MDRRRELSRKSPGIKPTLYINPMEISIDSSLVTPTLDSLETPTGKSADPMGKSTEKSLETPMGKSTERPMERPMGKPPQKSSTRKGRVIMVIESLWSGWDELLKRYRETLALVDPYIRRENVESTLLILASMTITWLVVTFNLGMGWIVFYLVSLSALLRRSHRRLKTRLLKETETWLAIKRLDTDSETVEWLNLFLSRFWLIYEPFASASIKESVDAILETSKPNFVDDLRLTSFTLGSHAPRIDSIRTYPGTEEDVLMMDWALSFTPLDEDALTAREKRASTNLRVELTARIGAGLASIPLPILLTELELEGQMRVQLKLMTAFPHIKSIELGFLSSPTVDFVLRPLKAMDLSDTPGLSTFISDGIENALNSTLVNPNKITIDIEGIMGPSAGDIGLKPVGILFVHVIDGRALKNIDMAGIIDPCAVVYIGGKEVARTRVISNSLNPSWNETFHLVLTKSVFDQLSNRSDELKIEVVHSTIGKKKLVGGTKGLKLHRWIKLRDSEDPLANPDDLKNDARPLSKDEHDVLLSEWGTPFNDQADVWKAIYAEDRTKKQHGSIRLDLSYFPVLDAENPMQLKSLSALTALDVCTGVLTIGVHQGKDLACSKMASAEVLVELNGKVLFKTPQKKRTNNPIWEFKRSVYVDDIASSLKFVVTDRGNSFLGECKLDVKTALKKGANEDWYTLYDVASGRLRLTFKWVPVDVEGVLEDIDHTRRKEPIGIARFYVRNAINLAGLRKSDCYMKIGLASRPIGATHVRENTNEPRWNETFFGVVYSRREKLVFEVLDWNNLKKDKKLGRFDVMLSSLLPCLEERKDDGLTRTRTDEALVKYETDGLEIQVNSESSVDVYSFFKTRWGPLYVNGAVVAEDDVETSEDDDEPEKDETEKRRLGGSMDLIRDKIKKKVRQRGHIHFQVDFFPVLPESIIRSVKIGVPNSVSKQGKEIQSPALDLEILPSPAFTKPDDIAASPLISPREIIDAHPSGILRFRVIEAKLPRPARAYFELTCDSESIFKSRPSQASLEPQWSEAFDKFIPDMATPAFAFYIKEQTGNLPTDSDPVLGHWRGDLVASLLGKGNNWVPIQDVTHEYAEMYPDTGSVKISVAYSPVQLDTVESKVVLDTGILNIDILSASDLSAVDVTGYSDPYCNVLLNGTKIHKTKVHKRALNPEFNETVVIPIYSRLRSTVEIEIKDWNALQSHHLLGRLLIHVFKLVPGQVTNVMYPLEDADRGFINLRLFYDPQKLERAGKVATAQDTEARLLGEQNRLHKFTKGLTTQIGTGFGLGNLIGTNKSDKHKSLGKLNLLGRESVESLHHSRGNSVEGAHSFASVESGPLSAPVCVLDEDQNAFFVGDVIIKIFGARNLVGVDNGLADPYVKVVQMTDTKARTMYKTSVCKKTVNPEWSNESVKIQIPPSEVRFVIKDHNTFKASVELGFLDLQLLNFPTDVPVDQWFPLSHSSGKAQGELHLSFSFKVRESLTRMPTVLSRASVNSLKARSSLVSTECLKR